MHWPEQAGHMQLIGFSEDGKLPEQLKHSLIWRSHSGFKEL